ncbi:MAG: hypothetical protein Ct9H300mP1_26300 [Planctomycetaceae bacterium]|nr:MAG: hypothetical protein Ct9H300mP1_26300 [Planctomycetaceae bacterium]
MGRRSTIRPPDEYLRGRPTHAAAVCCQRSTGREGGKSHDVLAGTPSSSSTRMRSRAPSHQGSQPTRVGPSALEVSGSPWGPGPSGRWPPLDPAGERCAGLPPACCRSRPRRCPRPAAWSSCHPGPSFRLLARRPGSPANCPVCRRHSHRDVVPGVVGTKADLAIQRWKSLRFPCRFRHCGTGS